MPISDIQPALERIKASAAKYQKFYDYFDGNHTWNYSSKSFKDKYGQRLQTLKENLCKTVVQAPASRLEIIGFNSEDKQTETDGWKLWKQSNMPLYAGAVHREAFKTGDAYVIVWKDEKDRVKFYPQIAANITVYKDGESGQTTKAVKTWTENKKTFVTIYYADFIERYVSDEQSNNFVLRDPQPIANPFKVVPVFHFSYNAEMQMFGNSILSDVIPLNDALNKSYADIFVSTEYISMRQRYVAGFRAEKDDETGKPIAPFKADDAAWVFEDEAVKIGEFTDADVEKLLKVKQEIIKDIALVSAIPPSYFNLEQTGHAMSGEALRKLEARFIAIIQDAQRSFGETWSEAMSLALKMSDSSRFKVQGSKFGEIEVQWSDAAPVSESEILDNGLKKLSLGWSFEQIQKDFGLSDEQIEKMKTENESREKVKTDNAARFFDSGNSLVE